MGLPSPLLALARSRLGHCPLSPQSRSVVMATGDDGGSGSGSEIEQSNAQGIHLALLFLSFVGFDAVEVLLHQ